MTQPAVLVVTNRFPPAGGGGYERICVDGVAALRAAGHRVVVLTTAPSGAEPSVHPADELPAPPGDAPLRTLPWWWRDGAWPAHGPRARLAVERRAGAALAHALRVSRAGLVSFWAMGGLPLSLLERVRRAGLPAVGVVGDLWMDYGQQHDLWGRAWRRAPLRPLRPLAAALGAPAPGPPGPTARWLCISDWVRERSERAGGPLPGAAVARPGVDPAAFPASASGPWAGRLLLPGRPGPQKGTRDAIDAVARLRPRRAKPDAGPRPTLTVDGPGAAAASAGPLGRHARALGLGDRVRFRRTSSAAVGSAYAAADAVLFPVRWPEPWGLVPLEAMAVGRPVVACATGGAAEYLRDEVNALLVPPGRPDALAGAIGRLADDPALRQRLVDGGRATAAQYTADAFAAAVVAWHGG